MTKLHQLKRPSNKRKSRRVGRGPGSGRGKTSGRGHKGQMQHGRPPRPGFEGGQMPLIRKMPKRGFTFLAVPKFQVVNLEAFESIVLPAEVNPEWMYENGYIRIQRQPVKILGDGDIKKAGCFKVHAVSRRAQEKIVAAGGEVQILK